MLVTRSAALLRKTATAIAANDLVINQDIKAFDVKGGYLPAFMLWAIRLLEPVLLGKVISVSTSHLDLNDVLALHVPDPPLALQQEFAAFAARVDKSRVVVERQIDRLQTLYDSLAQEYFG